MQPRLVATAGPLEGHIILLDTDEFVLGRKSSSQVVLNDFSVSRQHCEIRKDAEGFKIIDLQSQNGTRVNGVPVREERLSHGDRLRVGNSEFLFLLEETTSPPDTGMALEDRKLIAASTLTLAAGRVFDLASASQPSRVERALQVLLNISSSINSLKNLDALQSKLLESIFEVIPAERGAILLGDETGSTLYARDRLAGRVATFPLSRTLVQKVLRDKVGVLSEDVSDDETWSAVDSIVGLQIRTLLAVPLLLFRGPIGLIYLDSSKPHVDLDQNHLHLLTAIACIAAGPLDGARQLELLQAENRRLREESVIDHDMIGDSGRIRQVYQFIAKIAPQDTTVMITGESGTGKELVARAIHRNSHRAAKPFVAINCAALTETLLESELFGYEKGAFTGAVAQKKGKLEAANGGTLFLDEIGEIALSLQAKLLRVLQQREFERVGGTQSIHVDIRIIAATNRDLKEASRTGAFRQDLYFRLNVVSITMPPLRERRDDIPTLALYFARKFSEKAKRQVSDLSPEARAYLTSYPWPGNVRELENAIERAVVLGSSDWILPEDLPESILEAGLPPVRIAKYHAAIREAKMQLIVHAVEEANGNYTDAAKRLGVNPTYLHRLMRNLDIKPKLKTASSMD